MSESIQRYKKGLEWLESCPVSSDLRSKGIDRLIQIYLGSEEVRYYVEELIEAECDRREAFLKATMDFLDVVSLDQTITSEVKARAREINYANPSLTWKEALGMANIPPS